MMVLWASAIKLASSYFKRLPCDTPISLAVQFSQWVADELHSFGAERFRYHDGMLKARSALGTAHGYSGQQQATGGPVGHCNAPRSPSSACRHAQSPLPHVGCNARHYALGANLTKPNLRTNQLTKYHCMLLEMTCTT